MTQFWIFITILSIFTGCGYYYLGIRFLHRMEISPPFVIAGWFTILVLWLLTPTAYILSLFDLIKEKSKTFSLIAFLNFGFLSILIFWAVFSDLALFIYFKLFSNGESTSTNENFSGESRKDFLLRIVNPSILGISASLTGYGYTEAHRDWSVVKVQIPINNLPDNLKNFKIIQISDIHVGPTIKRDTIERLVEKVNSLDPDMVAITGDLVDGTVLSLRDDVAPLANLKSKYGSYFCTGNHEYYSGAISWIRELERLGIKVLLNTSSIIEKQNSKILISGVTDYRAGTILPEHETNPEACMINQPECDLKILLAHQPKSIYRAHKLGFHLQLSGHTHGGQYFPGNILIYLFQEFVKGLYRHGDTWLYVNRGTGYWGPPIRTGLSPEITEIYIV